MSNLSDRGTLRGTLSVGSESGGTDNYNQLENRPQINDILIEGNHTGEYYRLLDDSNIDVRTGHSGSAILGCIEYKGVKYNTYTNPFQGADPQHNGKIGLVPPPNIADRDKYLCGDGRWRDINTSLNYEIIDLSIGTTNTSQRNFTFSKVPKIIYFYVESNDNWFAQGNFIYGQQHFAAMTNSISGMPKNANGSAVYNMLENLSYSADKLTMSIIGHNPFGALNSLGLTGQMFIIY